MKVGSKCYGSYDSKAGTVKISATAGTVSGYYFLTVKDEKPNIEEINIIGATELFVDDYLKLNYQTDHRRKMVLWISDRECCSS